MDGAVAGGCPCETFEKVGKGFEAVSRMQRKVVAGWEDWVDPCVAMGCLWHEHIETKSFVGEEDEMRRIANVEDFSAVPKGRAGKAWEG